MVYSAVWQSRKSCLHQAFCLICLVAHGLLADAPEEVKSLLEQARTYEKAEDYAGAERSYRQALTLAPDDPEVLKRFGILYQTELKFAESIGLFQRALAVSRQYPEVEFFLGVSYLGLDQLHKTSARFQAEPKTPQPHTPTH